MRRHHPVSAARARLRRRRATRGAASVEAVVVIPFFLIILSATLFMGDLYNKKLGTQKDATQAAWQSALEGCKDGGGAEVEWKGGLPGTEKIQLGPAKVLRSTKLLKDPFGQVKAESSNRSTSTMFSSFSGNMTTSTVLACNEKAAPGDVVGSTKTLWSKVETPELSQ